MVKKDKTAHLIIDVQMGCKAPFLSAIGKAVDDIRLNQPQDEIVWITISDKIRLTPPLTSSSDTAPPKTRSIDLLEAHNFVRSAPDRYNSEDDKAIRNFLADHGPRYSEAMFEKVTFDAFTDPDMVCERPELAEHLAMQQPATSQIMGQPQADNLTAYLKSKGVKNVSLMGMVSENCVLESAMGAAIKGFTAEIRADLVIDQSDPEHIKPAAYYKGQMKDIIDKLINAPHELAAHPTKIHLADGDVFSPHDLCAMGQNITMTTSNQSPTPELRIKPTVQIKP